MVFVLSNSSLPNASVSPIESSPTGALSIAVSVVARSTTTIFLACRSLSLPLWPPLATATEPSATTAAAAPSSRPTTRLRLLFMVPPGSVVRGRLYSAARDTSRNARSASAMITCVDAWAVHAEDQLLLDVGRPRSGRSGSAAIELAGRRRSASARPPTSWSVTRRRRRGSGAISAAARPASGRRHDRAGGGDGDGAAGDRGLQRAEPLAVAGRLGVGTAVDAGRGQRGAHRLERTGRGRRPAPRAGRRRAPPPRRRATASGAQRSQVPCTASSSCWNRGVELVARPAARCARRAAS